jgi:hypothetical protein
MYRGRTVAKRVDETTTKFKPTHKISIWLSDKIVENWNVPARSLSLWEMFVVRRKNVRR